jgi:hypothetical protein
MLREWDAPGKQAELLSVMPHGFVQLCWLGQHRENPQVLSQPPAFFATDNVPNTNALCIFLFLELGSDSVHFVTL